MIALRTWRWVNSLDMCDILFELGRNERVDFSPEIPLLDLSKACDNISGERSVESHVGRAVDEVAECLEIGLGFVFA